MGVREREREREREKVRDWREKAREVQASLTQLYSTSHMYVKERERRRGIET